MAASVRTWVVVAALALALLLLPERPVVAEEESVAAATATASFGAGMVAKAKPKCQPGDTTGPCRIGAVHDPENSEEEGVFSVKARAPSGTPDSDSDDDYTDADLSKDDELVVLGH